MELTKKLRDFIDMDKDRDPYFDKFRRFYCLDMVENKTVKETLAICSNIIRNKHSFKLPFPCCEIVIEDPIQLTGMYFEEIQDDDMAASYLISWPWNQIYPIK